MLSKSQSAATDAAPRNLPTETNLSFLRSMERDEFLPHVSLWTILGGLFLIGTVGVGFALAAVIHYEVVVRATATVRPTGEIRLVQASTAGTIQRILVKENQDVKKGQAIAIVDDSRLQTKKAQLIGNIQNSRVQVAQIDAQIASLSHQRDFELTLMQRNIASAQAELQRQQREYQQQQVTTQTQVKEELAALELARVQMEQYQQLANTGAVAGLQISEKQQAFLAAQAKLERAQATLNPSKATVVVASERIAQEQVRSQVSLATLDKERKALLQRQTALQNEIDRNLKELRQVETELKKTVLRASDAGRVLKLDLRNSDQVVSAGQSIAQIAPGGAALSIKARVASQDISKIQICQQQIVSQCSEGKVQLRISAYPYPDYGILKGAVRAISPDTIAPQPNQAKAAYYEVTIQPEKPYLTRASRSYFLKSGMEVRADIISREETLLNFILRKTRLVTDL